MSNQYLTSSYLNKRRWISYWYQIQEISSLQGVHSILEIGPGNKIVADTFCKMGYYVKTLDQDPQTQPDFVADIRNKQRFPKEDFDLILCCQVLEHLPFSNFVPILKNLYALTQKYLLLSLPYTSYGTFKPFLHVHLLPFLKPISWAAIFNLFPRSHIFNSQHCWEIGKKGYSLKKIFKDIEQGGFKIVKKYPIPENPYHYMIVCKK